MRRRVLNLAICGRSTQAHELAAVVREVSSSLIEPELGAARIDVSVPESIEADESVAGAHHFVVAVGRGKSKWSDAAVDSAAEMADLTRERLVPWVTKWQAGRRAPRNQKAVLVPPDSSWAFEAARLITRIRANVAESTVLRVDHIGSTSVSGLAAKDLIDIQIIVPADEISVEVAEAVTNAGFVHVVGQWHGKDRDGHLHVEQVCVDSDPGRPVNVNIRSATLPVARDALLFRDWLRDNTDARDRYLATKTELAGRQIDDYGNGKEPFISAALVEAEAWAVSTGWTMAI